MCGFIGIAGVQPKNIHFELERASQLLIPRGPDDFTYYERDDFALCFRRIAIVGGAMGVSRLLTLITGSWYQ